MCRPQHGVWWNPPRATGQPPAVSVSPASCSHRGAAGPPVTDTVVLTGTEASSSQCETVTLVLTVTRVSVLLPHLDTFGTVAPLYVVLVVCGDP